MAQLSLYVHKAGLLCNIRHLLHGISVNMFSYDTYLLEVFTVSCCVMGVVDFLFI